MTQRRVFKYHIPVADGIWQEPMQGRIIHVDYQMTGMVTVWAEHADGEPKVARRFAVYGTGHSIPKEASYVGTMVDKFTSLVWHLYELPTEKEPS